MVRTICFKYTIRWAAKGILKQKTKWSCDVQRSIWQRLLDWPAQITLAHGCPPKARNRSRETERPRELRRVRSQKKRPWDAAAFVPRFHGSRVSRIGRLSATAGTSPKQMEGYCSWAKHLWLMFNCHISSSTLQKRPLSDHIVWLNQTDHTVTSLWQGNYHEWSQYRLIS